MLVHYKYIQGTAYTPTTIVLSTIGRHLRKVTKATKKGESMDLEDYCHSAKSLITYRDFRY